MPRRSSHSRRFTSTTLVAHSMAHSTSLNSVNSLVHLQAVPRPRRFRCPRRRAKDAAKEAAITDRRTYAYIVRVKWLKDSAVTTADD